MLLTSRWDCMSAMTGVAQSGSNSVLLVSGMPQTLRANSMMATWRPRQMPKNGRSFSRAQRIASIMPSTPRSPKPPGNQQPVEPAEQPAGRRLIGEPVARDPLDLHLGVVRNAAVDQRLAAPTCRRRAAPVYLPTTAIRTRCARVEDPLGHRPPAAEIGLPGLEPEPLADLAVEPLLEEAERDLVDRLDVGALDHAAEVHVAEERDLALDVGRDRLLAPADQDVGLDPDLHELADRVLGRLGLELARRGDVGHQGEVDEERVVAADLLAELADGLEERQRLDVAHRAADLGDHHVVARAPCAGWRS